VYNEAMKETFNKSQVFTCVTADDLLNNGYIAKGIYGYFAHDLEHLKKSVEENKQNRYCFYGKLTKIMSADNRARFVLDKGDCIFSLFYPTDWKLNTARY